MASLDTVAETLLAMQPDDVEYRSGFKTESIAVDVARISSDKDIHLDSGDIVANIPATTGSKTNDMLDVKVKERLTQVTWSSAIRLLFCGIVLNLNTCGLDDRKKKIVT